MKAMLIVAHGSRKQNSNDEIRQLTDTVSRRMVDAFDLIDCAFLELAEPSIEAGIDDLVTRGATRIHVVPYFLAAGVHVVSDIPEIINTVQAKHPDIEMTVTDYLGKSTLIPDVLIRVATE